MSRSADVFAEAVASYCAWCESAPSRDAGREARTATEHLARLYGLGLSLTLPTEFDEGLEGARPDDGAWQAVFARSACLPFQFYADVEPHVVPGEEPSTGDLADDLADVYRDLMEGLDLYRGGHVAEAEWAWCHSFRAHWGSHALSALRALHEWLRDQGW